MVSSSLPRSGGTDPSGPCRSTRSSLVCFYISSSLRRIVPRLLGARALVSLLLRPPVLSCRRVGGQVVGGGGAGFKQHSVFQGSGRGRLHDLLTHLADLQLETHLGGEGVRVASLEGGGGLSCGRSQRGYSRPGQHLDALDETFTLPDGKKPCS